MKKVYWYQDQHHKRFLKYFKWIETRLSDLQVWSYYLLIMSLPQNETFPYPITINIKGKTEPKLFSNLRRLPKNKNTWQSSYSE